MKKFITLILVFALLLPIAAYGESVAFGNQIIEASEENGGLKISPPDAGIEEERCTLKIIIDFVGNLFFSTYNVKMDVNGEAATLKHGKGGTFEYHLRPGKYTVMFTSEDSPLVGGSAEIDLSGDTEVSYKISCYSNEITVKTLYVENRGAVGENEAMAPVSASDCKYKNYAVVEKCFTDAGFTNITTEILYDIYWGFTDNGDVEQVSIAGNSKFIRGDIFPSDSKIVITYHMPEDDNPSNITMEKDSIYYDGKNYLDVKQQFENMGFTNISLDAVMTEDTFYADGEVVYVEIDGWSFDIGDKFAPDTPVYIRYYCVKTPSITESITIENNGDFAALMSITDQTDAATIKKYAISHTDDVIEFDGCIVFMMKHKNLKTRFDVCLAGCDYNASTVYGPLFAFEDVNYYDMNVSGSDSVAQGMNFRITAKIKGFSEAGGYIILKPVSLVAR